MGATDGATGSGASYVAGATGGSATVTLTSAQSGLPAHNHGTTITQPAFSTPKFTHSITQPAFTTPKFTHSVTQPTIASSGAHSHTTKYAVNADSGTAIGTLNSSGGYSATDLVPSTGSAHTHTFSKNVAVGDHAATACTRSTNVGVGDHAATACTRSTDVGVTVSNNTAADATAAHNNMPPFLAVYI